MTAHEACRKVLEHVNTLPAGLFRWDRSWEMAAEADLAFLQALNGGKDQEIRALGNALVIAWRGAADAWEKAGRP